MSQGDNLNDHVPVTSNLSLDFGMNRHAFELQLPERVQKPRRYGITVLIDSGLPVRNFIDVIESNHEFIDFVKFGWGTSVITSQLEEKLMCLQSHKIEYFFGGTLFEKFYIQGKVAQYVQYCKHFDCKYVEISNGTVSMSNDEKSKYIRRFCEDFQVFSEVGYKETEKSISLSPAKWISYIQQDLQTGATKVITEARESGTSGVCRANGEVRYGLIEEILESGIDAANLIFEAPNKGLQTYFIGKVGANVNLANIPFSDALSLETLRLGLRSDTLHLFEQAPPAIEAVSP